MPVEQAIVDAVAGVVAELPPTDRLIADVVLALGLLQDRLNDSPELSARLYRADLGIRRIALSEGWAALHELMGVSSPPPAPTVRGLRGSVEERTLGVLAERIVRAAGGVRPVSADERANAVVVVGGAVMDLISVVEKLPEKGESVQATSFQMNPGGKGLNLAVAGARMGFDVRFAAAVGDDEPATRLLEYMRSEDLSTDLIIRAPGEVTPVAQVIVLPNGDAATIGWKNELRVALSTRDMRNQAMSQALAHADAVLVTLEAPVDVVKWTLDTARNLPREPLVLLQASPPLERPQQIYRELGGVDYVVGSEWALRQLLPDRGANRRMEEVARQLRTMGVTTVCVVENFQAMISSPQLQATINAPSVPLTDSPGAREAFSAALLHHLLRIGRRALTEETLKWATAAMATNLSIDIITDAMPRPSDVGRTMESDQSVG
ncbi:PfkB family carbohydrate kinase [Actinophytocola sp.]|uniref:PfkB family carbohydrate kinase n=1 Tax=Actinophytocola sp. TaxID=1872138 RepID=UPI002D7785DA|nr:PfkB family carbohydrate kinase [Actinophytocola sp.]